MFKDDWVYIGHMLDMSKKALALSNALNQSAYDLDEKLRLALTHLVQVIGEADRLVSADFQDRIHRFHGGRSLVCDIV